jgi:hypothetical protein
MSTFAGYGAEHEETMRLYCASLPEGHRRRYAALEAVKRGRGGIMYVATVLGMSRRTIYTGIRELAAMDPGDGSPPQRPSGDPQRVRRRGGGRPKAGARQPGLKSACARILEAHGAGSPTDPDVVWTHLKPMQLAAELARAVSRSVATRRPDCCATPAIVAVRCARRSSPATSIPRRAIASFAVSIRCAGKHAPPATPCCASTRRKRSCSATCIAPVSATAPTLSSSTTTISAILPPAGWCRMASTTTSTIAAS